MENKNLDEVIQMLYGYLGGKCLSHEDLIIKIKAKRGRSQGKKIQI